MKNRISILLFACMGIWLVSCGDAGYNGSDITGKEVGEEGGSDGVTYTSEYDEAAGGLALAVSRAIQVNGEFKRLIHESALRQFDGDYDVLLKHVANKTLTISDPAVVSRAGKSEVQVKDILEFYFPTGELKTRADGENIIEHLQALYPNLQISVPVHAEEWDPEEYTPIVAFLPEDYSDATVKTIPGYDSEGNLVAVDAIAIPDKPVIVVGRCERTDSNGTVLEQYRQDVFYPLTGDETVETRGWGGGTPSAPSNLTATPLNNGIFLSWEQTGSAQGYYIYRKSVSEAVYRKIATIPGNSDLTYFDPNLVSNAYYHYYVTAYTAGGSLSAPQTSESSKSNTVFVQAPSAPAALSNFSAHLSGRNIELRWNNDGDNSSRVKVEYMAPEYGSAYKPLTTKTGGVNNYIYEPQYRGTKISYRAYRENSVGNSDAKYDFIYPPYRNSDAVSPVYVKKIKFTDWSLERWPAGKPEFYLKVVGVDNAGKTVELQRQIEFNFDSKSNESQLFTERKVIDWRCFSDRDWYSSLTFYLEEYDQPNAVVEFKASAAFNVKLAEVLEASLGAEITVTFDVKGELCGSAYINYFDIPEQWIAFPNYGVEMLISENPR